MKRASRTRRWPLRIFAAVGVGLVVGFFPLPKLDFANVAVGHVLPLPTMDTAGASEVAAQQAVTDTPFDAPRVTGADTDTGAFTSIGVTFDKAPTQPVLVRIRDDQGAWGNWRQMDADPDGPDPGSKEADRAGTAPLWVKNATGYQVSLSAADAGNSAKVVVVQNEQQRVVTDATPVADAAWGYNMPFGYTSRASWGARAPSYSLDVADSIHLAVVHHSDSGNDYSPADVPAMMRSIQAYHMDGRGWSDIGYNFAVDKFGGIWEGRCCDPWQSVIGAHAAGFNTGSVGIVVLGDYTTAAPTAAALNSVGAVTGWKLAMFGIDPLGSTTYTSGGSPRYPAGQVVGLPTVVGHQDVGLTDCPGSVEGQLGYVRARSRAYFDQLRSVGNHNPVGSVDFLQRSGNSIVSNGWAFDPDTRAAISIIVSVDGVWYWNQVTYWRPENVFPPGWGQYHGYSVSIPVTPGKHNVCIFAMNPTGPGADTQLLCKVVK